MQIPRGKLIAIGGNVDKGSDPDGKHHYSSFSFFEFGILQRILSETRGKDSRIEVVTTASMIPEEVGNEYLKAFARLGAKNIGVMHIRDRKEAFEQQYVDRLAAADGVMLTGGNQLRLTTVFGGTPFHKLLLQRYWNDSFMISGTSAGAMAMSNTMIYEGESEEALLKGTVKMTTGLALIKDVIIDTHFIKRGRFGRLAQAVVSNPGAVGIGLADDTGLLITEGNYLETIGSGLVLIFDGTQIRYTNIAELPAGLPISMENLVVHALAKGNAFVLNDKLFFPSAEMALMSHRME